MPMYKTVLLCYDGSAEGRKALREGALLARAVGAQTHLLAICRDMASSLMPEAVTSTLVECEEHVAQSILDQGVQKLRELGIDAQGTLLIGDPAVHIPSFAAKIDADLVVIGHRQRSRLARWWTDSPHPVLLHRVSCSLLVAMNTDPAP
jgi:nucleotide-binding universal stress UspA family protein